MSDSLATAAEPLGTFRVGAAISRSFGLLFSNIAFFLPLALVPGISVLFFPIEPGQVAPSAILPNLLIFLGVLFILFPFVQATILHAAFQSMRGRPISVGDSFSVGLTRFLPLLGTLFCAGAAVMLGF